MLSFSKYISRVLSCRILRDLRTLWQFLCVSFNIACPCPPIKLPLSQIKSKLAIESARYTSPSAPPRSQVISSLTNRSMKEHSVVTCVSLNETYGLFTSTWVQRLLGSVPIPDPSGNQSDSADSLFGQPTNDFCRYRLLLVDLR